MSHAFSHLRNRALQFIIVCAVVAASVSGAWLGIRQAQAVTVSAPYPVTVKLLVVLVAFNDAPGIVFTKAQAEAMYFGPTNSVAAYWNANSHGRVTVVGDVAGPFIVPRSTTSCDAGYLDWGQKGIAAARAAGYVPENYQYIQYDFEPKCSSGSVGWGDYPPGDRFPANNISWISTSTPAISGAESWIFGYFYVSSVSHEIGHTFGNGHADAPTGSAPSGYRDLSDVMGDFWLVGGYAPLMFNAPHQINMNWLRPGETQAVTTSGTYTINSLESDTGTGILRIARAGFEEFTVSMRQATGMDANMPAGYSGGAAIHQWYYAPGYGSQSTTMQKVLTDGATFTDNLSNVTIKQISHTASTVTVDVSIAPGACIRRPPTVTTTPASSPGMSALPGGSATLALSIKNNDSVNCSPTPMSISRSLPPGWTGSFSQSSITGAPGVVWNPSITVTNPATTTPSATPYLINYSVTAGTSTNAYVMYYYVNPPCTNVPATLKPVTASSTAAAGTATPYKFTLKNNDPVSCAASTFLLSSPSLPAGWVFTAPAPVVLAGGATATLTGTTTSPLTASGTTTIAVQATDSTKPAHNTATSIEYGVPGGACVAAAPTVSATPSFYANAGPGAGRTYSVSVTNNDTAGCAPSTFTLVSPVVPSGWGAAASSSNINLPPGTLGNINETITSAAGASFGTTSVTLLFDDAATGAAHDGSTTVQYGIPAVCVRSSPSLTLSPMSQTNAAGAQLVYALQLTNRDSAPCAPSSFSLTLTVPAAWSGLIAPLTLTPTPGAFQQATFSVTSYSGASDGDYLVSVTSSSAGIPEHSTTTTATYTVGMAPPPPPPLTSNMSLFATRVHAGGSSTLTWWVSAGLAQGITCSITPAAMIQSGPTSISGSGTITSWGSFSNPVTAYTVPITGTTAFTLQCSNGAGGESAISANATLVPLYQDL